MDYVTLTARVPASVNVISHDGKTVVLDFAELSEAMRGEVMYQGALRVLRDCKAGKTEAEAFAGTQKRVDAWVNGDWSIVARTSNQDTILFMALREHMETVAGKTYTDKGFAKFKLDTVKQADGRVTFDDFAAAYAKARATADRSAADIEAAMRETLGPIAERIAEEQAKASAAIEVPVDLF